MSDLSFTSSHNSIHLIATRYVSSWLEHILSGHAQITKTSLRLRIAACYSCIFTDPLCKRYRVSLLPSLLISKSDPRVSLTVLFHYRTIIMGYPWHCCHLHAHCCTLLSWNGVLTPSLPHVTESSRGLLAYRLFSTLYIVDYSQICLR